MQAGKNEIIVHAWAVEETPWTYEPSQQIEVGNDQSSLSKVIAACVSTASMNIAITQLSRKPVNESYGNTLQYPVMLLPPCLRNKDNSNGREDRCAIRGS